MFLFRRFFDRFMKYGLEFYGRYYSEYDGVCVDNEDPEEQGRIKVKVPQVSGRTPIGSWAWPATTWSGRNSGCFVVPDVNDPVIVTFRNGDPSYPRYTGGSWPKVDGTDNFTPTGMYIDGKPLVRAFRTKAGHELSFCDDPENLSCKLIWKKVDGDDEFYSFVAMNKDGTVQVANHLGAVFEMRALGNDSAVNMLLDSYGNTLIQDKDGTKIVDSTGNVVEMKKDMVQILGTKDVVVNSKAVNIKTGGVVLGDGANQKAIRGDAFMQWLITTFLVHYKAHIHPTGVGPSGVPTPPEVMDPVEADVMTDKVVVP